MTTDRHLWWCGPGCDARGGKHAGSVIQIGASIVTFLAQRPGGRPFLMVADDDTDRWVNVQRSHLRGFLLAVAEHVGRFDGRHDPDDFTDALFGAYHAGLPR